MTTKPRNPFPTVDIIIEMFGSRIVLIERKNPPHGWALPGGFVDYGESFEQAAVREAKEECGLTVTLLEQFHAYSDPARDPRQHTVSVVYIANAHGIPKGEDDALRAIVIDPHALPAPMAFDHAKIIQDYLLYRKTSKKGCFTLA